MSMGGGGGGGVSRQITTQELSPQQQELLDLVIPRAREFVNNPPQMFPGSAIAPISPLTEEARRQALSSVSRGGDLSNLAGSVRDAQQFLSGDVLDLNNNPALRQALDAAITPLTQQYARTILPAIRGEAIKTGGFGGSRQGVAEGIASDALLRSIGETGATFLNRAYADNLEALTRGLLSAPQSFGVALQPTQIREAIGIAERGEEQALLDEEVNRFISEQLIPFMSAQEVANLAFGIPEGQLNTFAEGLTPRGPSGFQRGLSGAASGAVIGTSISPGYGTAIGAAAGLLFGLMSGG